MPRKAELPGKRSDLYKMDPNKLVVVGIDVPNEDAEGNLHPLADPERTKDLQKGLDDNMVRNIMYMNVKQSVSVRKNGDAYEVVAGRRRVMHAREANKRLVEQGREPLLIPAIIERGDDGMMMGYMVAENEIRKDDTFLSKAKKALRLAETGKSNEEIRDMFGLDSTKQVENWLKVFDLDKKIIKAVEKGEIAGSAAIELAPLAREEQVKAFEKLQAEGRTSTADLKQARKNTKARKNGQPELSKAPSKRVIKKLLRQLGSYEESPLSDEFVRGVRWVMGDLSTQSIKGLSGVLNDMAGGEG